MGFRPEGSFHAKQVSSCQASRQAGHHRMREPLTHKNSLIDFQMADRPQSPHTALRFLNSFVVAEGSKCECVRIVHNYLMLIVYHTVLEVQMFSACLLQFIYIYSILNIDFKTAIKFHKNIFFLLLSLCCSTAAHLESPQNVNK